MSGRIYKLIIREMNEAMAGFRQPVAIRLHPDAIPLLTAEAAERDKTVVRKKLDQSVIYYIDMDYGRLQILGDSTMPKDKAIVLVRPPDPGKYGPFEIEVEELDE